MASRRTGRGQTLKRFRDLLGSAGAGGVDGGGGEVEGVGAPEDAGGGIGGQESVQGRPVVVVQVLAELVALPGETGAQVLAGRESEWGLRGR